MTDPDVVFATSDGSESRLLAVTGEIDLAVARRFAEELNGLVDEASATGLVDLSGVTFIDSSGVRELLGAMRNAEAKGGRLVLLNPSAQSRRVLEVSGVWEEFAVQEAPK